MNDLKNAKKIVDLKQKEPKDNRPVYELPKEFKNQRNKEMKGILQLDENYRLRYDEHNWILESKTPGKNPTTGKDYSWGDNRYFGNIRNALERYVDLSLKGDISSVGAIIDKLDQVQQIIMDLELPKK